MAPPILKRYLLALVRYPWAIPLGIILGVGGAGFVVSQPEPPVSYTITATLVTNRPPTIFSATGSEIRQPIESFTADTLLTENVIKETAKKVGLDPKLLVRNLKITLPSEGGGKKAAAVPEGGGQVKLEYKDTDQGRNKQVMEFLVRNAIDQSKVNNTARLRSIIDSLNQRLPQVKGELTTAEQGLEQYDRTEGPVLFAAQNGSLVQQIQQSEGQQRQMQLELEGINAELGSLQQKLGLSVGQAYVSSALSADPIVADLRAKIYQAESQLALQGKDLRPEHPTMVQLTQQKDTYEAQLKQRANEVIGGGGYAAPLGTSNVRQDSNLDPERQRLALRLVELTTSQERLGQQLRSLGRSELESRQQLTQIPNKQLARARLEDQLRLKKALHDQMQAKLVDAKTAEAETVSSLSLAQVMQPPLPPKVPKSMPTMIAIGGLVGLILGAGAVFLLDMLEGMFYTPEDLREALKQQDVQILGLLPLIQSLDNPRRGAILTMEDSVYFDYYERLRSLLRRPENGNPRVVMVTSVLGGEGKTVTAYNLAIASARVGKRTLLIEADARSGSIAQTVGVEPNPDALLEPLRYYGQISDCMTMAPLVENLYVVASCGPQRQTASIIESSEMRRLLEDARGRFDFVVLDASALSKSNDALLLEPYTDGMILVTRPGITQQAVLTEAVNELTESEDVRLLGAVVNAVPVDLPKGQVIPTFSPEVTDVEVAMTSGC
jgi:capsular exopolysaccharide synthesis family protein